MTRRLSHHKKATVAAQQGAPAAPFICQRSATASVPLAISWLHAMAPGCFRNRIRDSVLVVRSKVQCAWLSQANVRRWMSAQRATSLHGTAEVNLIRLVTDFWKPVTEHVAESKSMCVSAEPA